MKNLNLFTQKNTANNEVLHLTETLMTSSSVKGTLPKACIDGIYYKAGRMHSRDFPFQHNIEPLIEYITYKLGVLLNLPVLQQELTVKNIELNGNIYNTFVNESKEFKQPGDSMIYLKTLFTKNKIQSPTYEAAAKYNVLCRRDMLRLILFDLIILNEDRHLKNVAWLLRRNIMVSTPIFDNGFSLLYDTIRDMTTDFKRASEYCQCNGFYLTFRNAAEIFSRELKSGDVELYSEDKELAPLIGKIDLNCTLNSVIENDIDILINSIETEYCTLCSSVDKEKTAIVDHKWFASLKEFLKWRIDYVRSLQYC